MRTERRMTDLLIKHWEAVKPTRQNFPSVNGIQPELLREIWDHCFIIQVRDEKNINNCRFSFVGSAVKEICGIKVNDMSLANVPHFYLDLLTKKFNYVLSNKKFWSQQGSFTDHNNNHIIYRQCLLPLGEGSNVTDLIGAISWKKL